MRDVSKIIKYRFHFHPYLPCNTCNKYTLNVIIVTRVRVTCLEPCAQISLQIINLTWKILFKQWYCNNRRVETSFHYSHLVPESEKKKKQYSMIEQTIKRTVISIELCFNRSQVTDIDVFDYYFTRRVVVNSLQNIYAPISKNNDAYTREYIITEILCYWCIGCRHYFHLSEQWLGTPKSRTVFVLWLVRSE